MKVNHMFCSISIIILFFVALMITGCQSNRLTNEQKARLLEQGSKQNHETMLAMMDQMDHHAKNKNVSTAPYSLRLKEDGTLVLAVTNEKTIEYQVDIDKLKLVPIN